MSQAFDKWQPLVHEKSVEPIIVMCPAGGELRCFPDGTIVCIEGSRQWEFTLPPGVRLFHDTEMPLANADQWAKDRRE